MSAAAGPAPTYADLRSIRVHLTAWAPGCAELLIGDPGRRRRFETIEPPAIFARLVRHLGLPPAALSVETDPADETEVHLVGPVGDPERPRQPLAVFWLGVSAAEAGAWLAALADQPPQAQGVVA